MPAGLPGLESLKEDNYAPVKARWKSLIESFQSPEGEHSPAWIPTSLSAQQLAVAGVICGGVGGVHTAAGCAQIMQYAEEMKKEWPTYRQIALEIVSNEILDDSDIKGDSTTFANRAADAKAQLHLNRAANNQKWTAMIEKKEEDMKLKHDILVETRAGLPLKKDLFQVMLRYFTAKLGEIQTPNHSAVEDFLTPTSPDLPTLNPAARMNQSPES